jgi:hypothetical protein
MLPPPLAQAADKKSVSPSVEAHLKDAPNLYGRVPAVQLLLPLCLRAQWCRQASSLSFAPFPLRHQRPIFERRAHANAETLSFPLRCWKKVEGVKLRTCFVGWKALERGQTVSGPQRLNFPKTPPQAEAHQNLCSKPFLEMAFAVQNLQGGPLRKVGINELLYSAACSTSRSSAIFAERLLKHSQEEVKIGGVIVRHVPQVSSELRVDRGIKSTHLPAGWDALLGPGTLGIKTDRPSR